MSPRLPRIEVAPVTPTTKPRPSLPHFWRLVAGNDDEVCRSNRTYTNRRGAIQGAKTVAVIAAQADIKVVEA